MKSNPLPAWSWQEIYKAYRHYGELLIELARVKQIFGFEVENHVAVYVYRGGYDDFDLAQGHFQRSVDETDGMLILLDAEIKRRNALIGVMG